MVSTSDDARDPAVRPGGDPAAGRREDDRPGDPAPETEDLAARPGGGPADPAPETDAGDLAARPGGGPAVPAPETDAGGPADPAPGAEGEAGGGTERAGEGPGGHIVRWSVWATAVFVVTSALAVAAPDTFSVVSVPVALALFAVGSVVFVWGFLVGVGRSRYEAVTLGGLFFLAEGTAPAPVRRALRALLAVQVVVAVTAAAVRPFTELAFGVLVPTLGLGAITLWAARYGAFAPREGDDRPGARGPGR